MDKGIVVYVKMSQELKDRALAIGKQHGHLQARSSNNVQLSSVIRWLATIGADVVEQENGKVPDTLELQTELTQLRAENAQLTADLAAAEMRAASLTRGRMP